MYTWVAHRQALVAAGKATRYLARIHLHIEGNQRHLLIDKPSDSIDKSVRILRLAERHRDVRMHRLPLTLASIVQLIDNGALQLRKTLTHARAHSLSRPR
jgi:hypothetical protein